MCEHTSTCPNPSKFWVYRGHANRLVCGLHVNAALVEFTDPNRVWSENYKVTDESQVTVRRLFIGNGTPYPYMTARVQELLWKAES